MDIDAPSGRVTGGRCIVVFTLYLLLSSFQFAQVIVPYQGSCELRNAIRGMPGSEFEPRSPLQNVLMKDATQKTPHKSAAFSHIMRHF